MRRVFLQDMAASIPLEILPAHWTAFDLTTFSRTKRLYDYQQWAVENAIKVLWKYYEDFRDYQPHEGEEATQERKRKFHAWYRDNGHEESLDIRLNANRTIARLLEDYYEVKDSRVPYEQLINRACFWMATGSGKTLVIVKLIQVLRELIQAGEIPAHDILILTHRDDLIHQLRVHVDDFNAAHSDLFIRLRELREYATAKRGNPTLFKDREATVFYYRSDNLSDEQKEKIIDFRSYDDAGKWYVLLDEAHKGDKEDSKRQHIYAILSRNGFLFNFSATFTDARDILTTASNFNLSEFIRQGYGKHIAILKQEIRAFRDKEDYNAEEKRKVVLKSLMMLAYVWKFSEKVRRVQAGLYHRPLLLTLVNSVQTTDSDLKLFFRELERIGKGEISADLWKAAKDELWDELKEHPPLMFEEDRVRVDQAVFDGLSQKDILKHVFNASASGDIEILVRPSNRQELAFKLKTSDRPFALIKIGDIAGWLKEELAGYEVNERFEDEGYFERLNMDDSDITILMGSRSFYEGWDSNRPNVINYINIGTGLDAKKFILQSVGRGVRIEPLKNMRKRLLPLHNANEVESELFQQIKDRVLPLETLFIFGTNRNALQTVIEQLDQESDRKEQHQLSLLVNEATKQHRLLIPTYRTGDRPLINQRLLAKFEIAPGDLDLLKRYAAFIPDDRVLLALYETEPRKIEILRNSLAPSGDGPYYSPNGRSLRNVHLLVRRILDYFSITPQEFERLKVLEEEIRHFKSIQVALEDISDLKQKIESVQQYKDPVALEKDLDEKLECREITLAQYKAGIKETARMVREEKFEYQGRRLRIRNIANHYYIPLMLSDEEKIDFIKHIVKTPSEVRFINNLERYLQQDGNRFLEFAWWFFSKLDESLDGVHIPYYDPKTNAIRQFKPDFIFWLQKGGDYYIVFIDPKGTAHTDYQRKIDGYSRLFEEGDKKPKVLHHEGMKARVFTFLYTDDANRLSEGYKRYWFDTMDTVLARLGEASKGRGV